MKRACHKNEEAQDINDWENDFLTNIVQGCPIKYLSVKLQTEKYLKALEAAIQTLRKTDCYGDKSYQLDFEWPKANDLLQMPKNMPIQIKDLQVKNNGSYFYGFQFILSNGV